jgi:hypothetical protein
MRRILTLALLAGGTLPAQIIVNPSKFSPALKQVLDNAVSSAPLKCDVTILKPALNFGFRFQAGFIAGVPLNQFRGTGHSWAIVTKITPQDEPLPPVFLISTATLPDIPNTKQHGETGGAYLLGEGNYHVDWMLFDETKRVCRKSWTIKVALSASERKVKTAMPPNAIGDLTFRGSTYTLPDKDDVRPVRITILLHAAPLFPRRTRIRPSDGLMLLGSLSSLLSRLPSPSVRLVVFNMDQQKEVYRQDGFSLDSLDQVSRSISQLELGLVDYHSLENRHAPAEFLTSLINRELIAKDPSEIVLFLGPPSRFGEKIPQTALEERTGSSPYFFSFQFEPWLRRPNGGFPDTITQTVGRLKGKTITVHTPGEFAKAIEQLENHTTPRPPGL